MSSYRNAPLHGCLPKAQAQAQDIHAHAHKEKQAKTLKATRRERKLTGITCLDKVVVAMTKARTISLVRVRRNQGGLSKSSEEKWSEQTNAPDVYLRAGSGGRQFHQGILPYQHEHLTRSLLATSAQLNRLPR